MSKGTSVIRGARYLTPARHALESVPKGCGIQDNPWMPYPVTNRYFE